MNKLVALMKQSLGDDDIMKFMDNDIQITKYSDIRSMKSIDDLLGKFGRCIILFEIEGFNNGHWTLLQHCKDQKSQKSYLLFFDSYGYMPENELNAIDSNIKKMTDQHRGYLLRLLYDQPLQVRYNQFKLQKLKSGVNTCGKWCCIKGLFPCCNETDFAELVQSTNYTPDELICLLYESMK